MMAFDAMAPAHLAFLYELYTRSAGDARQGVSYEGLIDALGFDARVTKRIQHELQREGLVDLDHRPCDDPHGASRHGPHAAASPPADDRHDTSRDAAHGGHLRDACGHGTSHPLGVSTRVRAKSWSTSGGGLFPVCLDTSAPGDRLTLHVARPSGVTCVTATYICFELT
jgi:hypothetical protein